MLTIVYNKQTYNIPLDPDAVVDVDAYRQEAIESETRISDLEEQLELVQAERGELLTKNEAYHKSHESLLVGKKHLEVRYELVRTNRDELFARNTEYQKELKQLFAEKRQISQALELEGADDEDVAPIAFILSAIEGFKERIAKPLLKTDFSEVELRVIAAAKPRDVADKDNFERKPSPVEVKLLQECSSLVDVITFQFPESLTPCYTSEQLTALGHRLANVVHLPVKVAARAKPADTGLEIEGAEDEDAPGKPIELTPETYAAIERRGLAKRLDAFEEAIKRYGHRRLLKIIHHTALAGTYAFDEYVYE